MHPPTNTGKHNNVQQKQYQHHPSTIHNFPSNEQGPLLPRTMRHSKATQSSQHATGNKAYLIKLSGRQTKGPLKSDSILTTCDRKQGLSYQIIR